MSLVANTAPHLPYLRRFARALTGGQKSGDAYVVSVLEALVADPESFDTENDPRVELFKAFCRIGTRSRSTSRRTSSSRTSSTAPRSGWRR